MRMKYQPSNKELEETSIQKIVIKRDLDEKRWQYLLIIEFV
ncbi:MAG: hypothetical protein Ct9H90mP13_00210 [Pseudomonadota bacterium]|nr:MAG: hypothetical protein Ct9H90mP13_00210 [Pseudomonadota bacterium]